MTNKTTKIIQINILIVTILMIVNGFQYYIYKITILGLNSILCLFVILILALAYYYESKKNKL